MLCTKFIILFADAYVYLCAKVTIIQQFLNDFKKKASN
jgi:hypothetical protein